MFTRSSAGEISFAVYLPLEFVCDSQMLGLVDLRFVVRIAAASCWKHTFAVKTDIVYQNKFVVRHSLFKSPEEVVCHCHKLDSDLNIHLQISNANHKAFVTHY